MQEPSARMSHFYANKLLEILIKEPKEVYTRQGHMRGHTIHGIMYEKHILFLNKTSQSI